MDSNFDAKWHDLAEEVMSGMKEWRVLLEKHIRSELCPPLPNLAIAVGDRSQKAQDRDQNCNRVCKMPWATAEPMGGSILRLTTRAEA